MAGKLQGGSVTNTINNVIQVTGEKKIASLESEIKSIGEALNAVNSMTESDQQTLKYYKEEKKLIEDAIAAAQRLNNVVSSGADWQVDSSAKELLNIVNALEAKGGSVSFFDSIDSDIKETIEYARSLENTLTDVINPSKFARNFSVFDTLSKHMSGFGTLMQKILDGLGNSDLRVQNEELAKKLLESENYADELYTKLSNIQNTDFGDALKQLEAYKNQLSEIRKQLVSDFGSELYKKGLIDDRQLDRLNRGSQLLTYDDNTDEYNKVATAVNKYVEQIKNGESTVSKAVINMQQSFSNLVTTTSESLSSAGMQQIADTVKSALKELSDSTQNLKTDKLSEASSALSKLEGVSLPENFQDVIKSLNVLGETKVDSIIVSIEQLFNTLQKGDIAISNSSIVKFAEGLKYITEGMDTGSLTVLSHLSFDKLNNLKISSTVKHLREQLAPFSNEVNVENLTKLSNLNFDNLNNIKLSKSQMEGLAAFSNKTDFSSMTSSLDQLATKLDEVINKMGSSTEKAKSKLASLGDIAVDQKLRSLENTFESLSVKMRSIDDADYLVSSLEGSRNAIDKLWADVESGEMHIDEFNSRFRELAKELKLLNDEVRNFNAGEKVNKSLELIADDPEKLRKATTEVNNLQNSIKKMLDEWTKGKGTEPYEELKNLANQVEDLKSKMGSMTLEEFRTKLDEIKTGASNASNGLQQMDKAAGSLGTRLKSAFHNYASMFTGTMAIAKIVQEVRQAVSATIELDSSMTQLQIVTKKTDSELVAYTDTIVNTANKTAAAVKDVVDAMTTYARLGFDLRQSTTLADLTGQLQNVGGIEASAAQDAITAIIKAFDINVDGMEAVMDKLVEVGNNAPISVSQLAEGMNNASAILATATENSFDKSIALLTSANTTIQNISKSSTALRTIIARIRKVDTELDELGEVMTSAEYDELTRAITDQGVALVDEQGELRNTYDVLQELSVAWQNMTANEKASLAQMFGSTRNQNVFTGLMDNFKEATSAMDLMAESEGALSQANDVYLESIQAHIQQLRNTFDTILNRNSIVSFITDIVDVSQWLLNAISDVIGFTETLGGLKTVLVAVVGSLLAIKTPSIIDGIKKLGAGFKNFFSGLKGLPGAINATQVALLGITTAITAAAAITNLYAESQRKLRESAKSAADESINVVKEHREESDSVDELIDRYKELASSDHQDAGTRKEIESIQARITDLVGDQVKNLDLVNGNLKEQLETLNKIKNSNYIELINEANKAYVQAVESARLAAGTDEHSFLGINWASGAHDIGEITQEEINALGKYASYYRKVFNGARVDDLLWGGEGDYTLDLSMYDGAQDKIKVITQMMASLQKYMPDSYMESALYANLQDVLAYYDEYISAVEEAAGELTEVLTNSALSSDALSDIVANDADEFENVVNTIVEKISDSSFIKNKLDDGFFSEDLIRESVVNILSTMSQFSSGYDEWIANTNGQSASAENVGNKVASTFVTISDKIKELRSTLGDSDSNIVDILFRPQVDAFDLQEVGWNTDSLITYRDNLKAIGDEWNNLTNGNVDYNLRPLLDTQTMLAAGWEDLADATNEAVTTYTQGWNTSDFDIDTDIPLSIELTPILNDGSVLSPEALEDYLLSLDLTHGVDSLLASDRLQIVTNVRVEPEWDDAYWAPFEDHLTDIKERYEAVRNEIPDLKETLIKTFSNEDDSVAINFTPVILDKYGNVESILTPEELDLYAKDVIAGVREDDKNIQVGVKFEADPGEATSQAEAAADKIREILSNFDIQFDGSKYEGLIRGLTGIDSASQRASAALEKLNKALQDPEYDEGLDARISNWEKMWEIYQAGDLGSPALQALGEYFGMDLKGLSVDEITSTLDSFFEATSKWNGATWDAENNKWITDADKALWNWLQDIDAAEDTLNDLISWEEDINRLEFDPAIFFDPESGEQVASTLGMTYEHFIDFINAYRQKSPDFEAFGSESLKSWMETADLIDQVGDTTVINTDKFRNLMEALGWDYDMITDTLSKVNEIADETGAIQIDFGYSGTETPEQVSSDLDGLITKLREVGATSEEQAGYVAQALSGVSDEVRNQVLQKIGEAYGADFGQQVQDALAAYDASVNVESEGDAEDTLQDVYDLAVKINDNEWTLTLKEDGVSDLESSLEHIVELADNLGVSLQQTPELDLSNSVVAGSLQEKNAMLHGTVVTEEADSNALTVRILYESNGKEFMASGEPEQIKTFIQNTLDGAGKITFSSNDSEYIASINDDLITLEGRTGEGHPYKVSVNKEDLGSTKDLIQSIIDQLTGSEDGGKSYQMEVGASDEEVKDLAGTIADIITILNPETKPTLEIQSDYDEVKDANSAIDDLQNNIGEGADFIIEIDTTGADTEFDNWVNGLQQKFGEVVFGNTEPPIPDQNPENSSSGSYSWIGKSDAATSMDEIELNASSIDVPESVLSEVLSIIESYINDENIDVEISPDTNNFVNEIRESLNTGEPLFDSDSVWDDTWSQVIITAFDSVVTKTEEANSSVAEFNSQKIDTSHKVAAMDKLSSSVNSTTLSEQGVINKTVEFNSTGLDTSGKVGQLASLSDMANKTANTIRSVVSELTNLQNAPNPVKTITTQRSSGTDATALASGTKRAKSGLALLGDEYSPNGQPKPELVVGNGRAFVAGLDGPEFSELEAGDVVYPYEDTKKIIKGTYPRGVHPAFARGSTLIKSISKTGKTGGGGIADLGFNNLTVDYTDNSTNSYNYNSSGSTSSSSADTVEDKFEWVDWIEIAINRAEEAINRLKTTAESTYKTLKARLKATDKEISSVTAEIDLQKKAYDRYIKQANSVGLSADLAKRVREGKIDINEYDEATRELISDYQTWYEKALSCSDAVQQLNEDLAALYENKFEDTKTDYENWLGIYERRIEMLSTSTQDTPQTNMSRNRQAIKAENKEINILLQERADLIRRRDEAVSSGAITKWSEAYYAMSDAIDQVSLNIQNAHRAIGEFYIDNFNSTQEYYDNWMTLIDHMTNEYNIGMEKLEAQGRMASAEYYKGLISAEKKNKNILEKELTSLESSLQAALDSGEIVKFSADWYEMNSKINDTKEAIDQADVSLAQFDKGLRELNWSNFDRIRELVSDINAESNFLIDLMSGDNLYQDNGQFNNSGMATLGLRSQNYDVFMNQADQYAKAIKSINKDLANDPYNNDILNRRRELIQLQQEAIKSAEQEKQAIKSLVEEGIKIELENLKELIDTYKENLNSAKDLYEYQKKLADQTQNVSRLQKQLNAYANDSSEENRARVQKIRVELENAQEELSDMQYDRFVSDASKLLDDLYEDYETTLNQRLDDLDALIKDMIDDVNENAGTINKTLKSESASVGYTLSKSMSDIWAQGGGAHSVVSTYGDRFTSNLTSINSSIGNIERYVKDMIRNSDNEASETVQEVKNDYKDQNASVKNGWKKENGQWSYYQNDNPATGWKSIDDKWYHFNSEGKMDTGWLKDKNKWYHLNSSGAMDAAAWVKDNDNWYHMGASGAMDTGWLKDAGKWYYLNPSSGKMQTGWVQDKDNWYYLSGSGAMKTGWLKLDDKWYYLDPTTGAMVVGTVDINGKSFTFGKNGVWKGYKTGGLVDYTGLAQLDGSPQKPEIVLNAADSQNFLALRDTLDDLASTNKLKLLSDFGSIMKNSGPSAYDASIGSININIDHVEDYNDFVNQLRADKQFEKLIHSMTVDRIAGGNSLAKNRLRW